MRKLSRHFTDRSPLASEKSSGSTRRRRLRRRSLSRDVDRRSHREEWEVGRRKDKDCPAANDAEIRARLAESEASDRFAAGPFLTTRNHETLVSPNRDAPTPPRREIFASGRRRTRKKWPFLRNIHEGTHPCSVSRNRSSLSSMLVRRREIPSTYEPRGPASKSHRDTIKVGSERANRLRIRIVRAGSGQR